MNKMNKVNIHSITCSKITNNSTSIKLKYGINRIIRLYSNCVSACSLKQFTTIDREELSYYLNELSIKKAKLLLID